MELAIRTTGTEEEHKAARVLQQRLRRSMIRKKLQQKPVPDRDVFASREDEIATIYKTNDPRRHHDRAGHYTTLFANGPEFEGLVEETHQMHRVMLEQAVETALKRWWGGSQELWRRRKNCWRRKSSEEPEQRAPGAYPDIFSARAVLPPADVKLNCLNITIILYMVYINTASFMKVCVSSSSCEPAPASQPTALQVFGSVSLSAMSSNPPTQIR